MSLAFSSSDTVYCDLERTFETNLPNVVDIVQGFAYSHPIVDVGKLTQLALSASVRFLRTGPDLIDELEEP